jgi:hypothetical protein
MSSSANVCLQGPLQAVGSPSEAGETDIAGIEIPQCSSVLPRGEVLPFWSEAKEGRAGESSCCWA